MCMHKEPIKTTVQDSIGIREAPKARARRHRDTNRQETADSLKTARLSLNQDSITVLKTDSILMQVTAPVVADSLDKINKKNLEQIETTFTPPQPIDTVPPSTHKPYGCPILPKRLGWLLFSPAEDKFIIENTGSFPLFMVDSPDVPTH